MYIIKLKRSSHSMTVKHVTRNVSLKHVGRRGPQGPDGPAGTPANLKDIYPQLAGDLDTIISGEITRDANGAATLADVIWPDGETGVYTATEVSDDFPGAVDAYTVTYNGSPNRTYTQATVSRDETGAVINRPPIGVI